MQNQKVKRSNYLEEAVEEMKKLLQEADTIEDVERMMASLLEKRTRESFKNGIEVGMKRTGGQKEGKSEQREWKKGRYRGK